MFTLRIVLQVCKVQQYPFTDDQAVMQADWELYIQVQCQSVALGHCTEAELHCMW